MLITIVTAVLSYLFFLTADAAIDVGKRAQISSGAQSVLSVKELLHLQTISDVQLKELVQQQLRSQIKNYDPGKFKISSQNGNVIIEGDVHNQLEADLIEKTVLQVKGVEHVKNYLAVAN